MRIHVANAHIREPFWMRVRMLARIELRIGVDDDDIERLELLHGREKEVV